MFQRSFAEIGEAHKLGGLASVKNIFSNTITDLDVEKINQFNSELRSGVSAQTAWYRNMLDASNAAQSLVESRANLKKKNGELGVSEHDLVVAQQTAKQSTVGLRIATTALNTAINIGIGLLAQFAVTGLIKLINYEKDAAEAAKEAASNLKESNDTFKEQNSNMKTLAPEYANLSKKLNLLLLWNRLEKI